MRQDLGPEEPAASSYENPSTRRTRYLRNMQLYRHIGISVAFSPRLEALLREGARLSAVMAERVSILHVGPATPEKEGRLADLLGECGYPAATEVHWIEGDPASALPDAAEKSGLDLIVAGALEREQSLRYFLGSVARNLVREAPSSVFLFTEPGVKPEPMRRIVFFTDFSEHSLIALAKTIRFAALEKAEKIFVLSVQPEFGDAMVFSDGVRRDKARNYYNASMDAGKALLRDFVDAAGDSRTPVETYCLSGHGGQVTADFVRRQQADMLVMPSPDVGGHIFERIFPSDMEWILREIPCNLWVVRERINKP